MKVSLGRKSRDGNEEGLSVFQKKILFFFFTDWDIESSEKQRSHPNTKKIASFRDDMRIWGCEWGSQFCHWPVL